MNHKSIIARLEELERKSGLNLPVVYARYQNGETVKYYGLPPMGELFNDENPIIMTYGSSFADLVDALIHPVPNRDIEELERDADEE